MFRVDISPTQFFGFVPRLGVLIRLVGGQGSLIGSNVQMESQIATLATVAALTSVVIVVTIITSRQRGRSKAPTVNGASRDCQQFPMRYENDLPFKVCSNLIP